MFGSSDTQEAWERQCREAKASQRCLYAIAPLCSVLTHDGRRLMAGDEVQPARDFAAIPERTVREHGSHCIVSGSSVPVQLERLLRDGIVLERDGESIGAVTRSANYTETRLG
jgi:hypothetical protein